MADIETFAPAFGRGFAVTPGNTTASTTLPVATETLCITSRHSVECFVRVGPKSGR